MRILFKWPTRQRPLHFLKALARHYTLLSGSVEYQFLITADLDDETMNTIDMRAHLAKIPNLKFHFGDSFGKVVAINADMELADPFDIVVLCSDDMIPVAPKYDEIIATDMLENFPDLSGCLWYPDGRRRDLCTFSILGREYYKKYGYIYHPSYCSLWCDNEFHDVANRDGKLKFIDRNVIHHAWMDYTGNDALHARNSTSEIFERDKKTYERRKSLGFPR